MISHVVKGAQTYGLEANEGNALDVLAVPGRGLEALFPPHSRRADPHDSFTGHFHHQRRGSDPHPGADGGQPDDPAGQETLRRQHPLRPDGGEARQSRMWLSGLGKPHLL